jgi:hypothetical protein
LIAQSYRSGRVRPRPGVTGSAQATQNRAVQESCYLAGFKRVQLVEDFDVRVSNRSRINFFGDEAVEYVFISAIDFQGRIRALLLAGETTRLY